MDDNFLKEIQDSFLNEAIDNLAQSEELFLALEKKNKDKLTTLLQIKRMLHNFKGSAKAVGFDDLSTFCHAVENLIIAVSSEDIILDSDVIDLLLQSNDLLKNDLRKLLQDKSTALNYDEIEQKIQKTIDRLLNGASASVSATDVATEVSSAVVAAVSTVDSDETQTVFDGTDADSQVVHKLKTNSRSRAKNEKKGATSTTASASVDDSIRIPMKRLEDLFNAFGEQVIHLSALDHLREDLMGNEEEIVRSIFSLKKITYDLQQFTLNLRMVGVKGLFGKLERAIRDVAKSTNKKVDCELIGIDKELDKIIVDQISDAFIHMARNAVDHGLETPEERAQASKPETGKIYIRAFREAGNFVFEIEDDGRGLDPVKIRNKAVQSGLVTADQQLSEKEIFDFLFESGFSTKEQVTEISGRGVGMNVVKETIQSLGGSYEIKSAVGKGTNFIIKLPLSLSLFNGLSVTIHDNKFIIPSAQVLEIVNSENLQIRKTNSNNLVVQVRDQIYPLIDLRPILGSKASIQNNEESKKDMIILSKIDDQIFCFRIQKVLGIIRVVQKPLSPEMTTCPGAVGVSILGDGNPVLILDLRVIKSELYHEVHGEVSA